MNKQELAAMVAEILGSMGDEPMVKGSNYHPRDPGPQPVDEGYREGDFVPDVTALDLRKLYLTENPENKEKYAKIKEKTIWMLSMSPCLRPGKWGNFYR